MEENVDVELTENVELVQQDGVPEPEKVLDEKAIEYWTEEYNTKLEQMQAKQYLIEGGVKVANGVNAWLATEAKWIYSECIAVTKLMAELEQSIKNIKEGKTGQKFYLSLGPLTALNYLFQKTEGKGFHSAKKFADIAIPIIDTMNGSVNKDNEIMKRLEFGLATVKEGLEPAKDLMAGIEDEPEAEITE